MSKLIFLERPSEQHPWGFRLQGGVDFNIPLSVQLVQPGSIAESCGLSPGDLVMRINNLPTDTLEHDQAKQEIMRSGNSVEVMIQRSDATVWKPKVTPISEIRPAKLNTGQFHDTEPVFTKTSLAANKQESLNIGSSHNRAPKPFGAPGGSGPRMVNAQYNTPIGMYSSDNVSEAYHGQAQAHGDEEHLYENAYDQQHDQPHYDNHEVKHYGYSNTDNQSRSFRRLNEELEGGGAPYHAQTAPGVGPAGFRSVRPPTMPVGGVQPPPQPTLQKCFACGDTIIGVFCKVKGMPMHPTCLKCVRCGAQLKNIGYFVIENKLYCETHAKQESRPGYGGYQSQTVYQ